MNIINCAKLCQQSYNGGSEWTDVEDLRFGVFQLDGASVIVFRGSSDMDNWLRDFSAIPARTKGGYLAHEGFVRAFDTLWPAIAERLPKDRPVIATGHSLGGAIAALCGEYLSCRAITFGCPRVYFRFSKAPAYALHKRIICSDDPVPFVPGLLFRHLCDPVKLLDTGVIINPSDHFITHYIDRLEAQNAAMAC